MSQDTPPFLKLPWSSVCHSHEKSKQSAHQISMSSGQLDMSTVWVPQLKVFRLPRCLENHKGREFCPRAYKPSKGLMVSLADRWLLWSPGGSQACFGWPRRQSDLSWLHRRHWSHWGQVLPWCVNPRPPLKNLLFAWARYSHHTLKHRTLNDLLWRCLLGGICFKWVMADYYLPHFIQHGYLNPQE